MRNLIATLLVLLFLVTACASGNLLDSTVNQSTLEAVQAPTTTLAVITQIPATATLQPTATPTLTPTPLPARFDRAGYRQFAITRSYFPGFEDFRGDRSYSEISSALSPDGNLIAFSACWGSLYNTMACQTEKSGFIVVIDVNSGELLNEIPMGDSWPGPLAFTPDGKNLLFSNDDLLVTLWDLTADKPVRTFYTANRTKATIYPDVAIAPDGSSFASVANDTLFVWNPSGGILFQTPAYNARASAALAYSADGSHLLVFSPDRIGLDIYSTTDWTLSRRLAVADVWDAEISPDGGLVASITSENKSVVVWDVDSGEQLAEIDPEIRTLSLQFNPAGDLLIIAGYGNLDQKDDYSIIGALFETQNWSRVNTLHSYSSEGKFKFNRDGSRMVVFGSYANTIWELPDAQLLAGFEVVQQFQQALAAGDYDTAASLFEVTEGEAEYLVEIGIDPNDLAGSFSALCEAGTIFCLPVKELVMMGYDWDTMTYLLRLEGSSGDAFASPEGATIIYLYLIKGADGLPRLIFPAMD
jgi:DNA-binding beta-propeller fold protein YncE